jgi:hypothetical protein
MKPGNIFINLISAIILLALGYSFYLGYQNFTSSEYTPDRVTERFITILQNPTDTITPNEKSTLSNITQTNFLQSTQNEIIITNLRKYAKNKEIKILNHETKDNIYNTYTLQISDAKSSLKVPIYLESTGTIWTGGVRSKIYKIEVSPEFQTPNFNGLKDQILDIFDKTKQTVTDKINQQLTSPIK